MWITQTGNFLLDILFPRFCFSCKKEGEYLCQDCQGILEISEFNFCLCKEPLRIVGAGKCQRCYPRKLNGLYFALPYQNKLCQLLLHQFKYRPYVKDLAGTLSSLIIAHFLLSGEPLPKAGNDTVLVPVPLDKTKLKWRGFNQSKELAEKLSESLNIALLNDVLVKIKKTPAQVEIEEKQREENVKGVFEARNSEKIIGKKIFLVDDVYTSGSTMEECALILKMAGAKEVWGIAVARG